MPTMVADTYVLFDQDKKQKTIVNNDSGEIMEMLNSELDSLKQDESCPNLYPTDLQSQIDELNGLMSDSINTGVYKCAFAKSQVSGMLFRVSGLGVNPQGHPGPGMLFRVSGLGFNPQGHPGPGMLFRVSG